MKKGICLALLLAGFVSAAFAYNYDTNLPLPGKSIADTKLQQDSLFTVYMFGHRIASPDCQNFSITDTKVSKAKVDNKWQEIWTVQACSKSANIPINFELKPEGATYAIDPMGVRVTTK